MAGASEFFYYESKVKIKKNIFFCGGGVGWGGEGTRVSEFFSTKNPNLNKKIVF